MANKYAQSNGNWSAGGGGGIWYDAASGGNEVAKPTIGDNAYLNGCDVTLDENVACDLVDAGATDGRFLIPNSGTVIITADVSSSYAGTMISWGTGTCSLTINGDVTYASTSTAGMLTVGTGQTLAVNGTVTNSSTGYGIVGSGTGVLAVSNVGSLAISNSGSGRCISWGSTGALSIAGASTGGVAVSAGTGIYVNAAASLTLSTGLTGSGGIALNLAVNVAVTISGNVSVTSASSYGLIFNTAANTKLTISGTLSCSVLSIYGAVRITGGTLVLDGPVVCTNGGMVTGPFYPLAASQTIQWTGARTLSSEQACVINVKGGTVVLATETEALTLTNSGAFIINKASGTIVTSAGESPVYTASIVNQSLRAVAACIGDDISSIITGPTLPAVGNVLTGSGTFGYAGDPQTPTATLPDEGEVYPGTTGASYGNPGDPQTGTLSAAAIAAAIWADETSPDRSLTA